MDPGIHSRASAEDRASFTRLCLGGHVTGIKGAHQVGVGEVGPVGYAVHAARVLRHHRVADVRKLAVLKHQEVCARVSDLSHKAQHKTIAL